MLLSFLERFPADFRGCTHDTFSILEMCDDKFMKDTESVLIFTPPIQYENIHDIIQSHIHVCLSLPDVQINTHIKGVIIITLAKHLRSEIQEFW